MSVQTASATAGDLMVDLASGHHSAPGWASRRRIGASFALLSLLAVATYVFLFTPYQEFLFSDMKHCWTQAMKRLNGQVFDDSQFVAWPPLYHIFLAEFFRVCRWLGLESLIRIETALSINLLAFSASVFALHRLAAHWFERNWAVLLTMALYGFGFPALYFNAFLLAENLGAPLLVIACSLIVCRRGWACIVGAAVIFAAAVIVRPAMGPYGLAFVACLLARNGLNRRFLLKSALFSAVFFALITLASLEVSRISQGRVNALSANGGLDFFIANTDYHRVDLSYNGWHFFVVVPAQSWKSEGGIFYTSTPFYNQSYYFDLGWRALKENPMRAVRNLGEIGNLFFADMLPSRNDAPGFVVLRPVWDWMKFLMFLPLGLYALAWRQLGERRPLLVLGGSLIGVTMLVSVIFTGEPRYAYAIIFVFYLLSLKLLEIVLADWRRWLRPILIYSAVLAALAGCTAGIIHINRAEYPPHVAVDFTAQSDGQTTRTPIGRARFPYNREGSELIHADDPALRFEAPGRVLLRSRMELRGDKPVDIILHAYSAWGFTLRVDGQDIAYSEDRNYFNENEAQIELTPGVHDIELETFYSGERGGLSLNYVYDGEYGLPVRRAVGHDSGHFHFSLPEARKVTP